MEEAIISEPKYEVAVQITPLSILRRLDDLGMNQEAFVRALASIAMWVALPRGSENQSTQRRRPFPPERRPSTFSLILGQPLEKHRSSLMDAV